MRLAIKISGRGLVGGTAAIGEVAEGLMALSRSGNQLLVSAGGGGGISASGDGNTTPPVRAQHDPLPRALAESAGILSTGINGCLLARAIRLLDDVPVSVLSGVPMPGLFETFLASIADQAMKVGTIVVHVHGIGQPFVTSDYCAVQRALETGCSSLVLLKNGIDAVMSADPAIDTEAMSIRRLSFQETLDRELYAVDEPAVRLAMKHSLPLRVIGISTAKDLGSALKNPDAGTWIGKDVHFD